MFQKPVSTINIHDAYKVLRDLSTGIILGQLNICSLIEHFDELKRILGLNSFDIFGLNETFLSDNVSDDYINVDNYYVYRRDRKCNTSNHRGGVAFYVNKHCKHVVRDDLSSEKLELELLN